MRQTEGQRWWEKIEDRCREARRWDRVAEKRQLKCKKGKAAYQRERGREMMTMWRDSEREGSMRSDIWPDIQMRSDWAIITIFPFLYTLVCACVHSLHKESWNPSWCQKGNCRILILMMLRSYPIKWEINCLHSFTKQTLISWVRHYSVLFLHVFSQFSAGLNEEALS